MKIVRKYSSVILVLGMIVLCMVMSSAFTGCNAKPKAELTTLNIVETNEPAAASSPDTPMSMTGATDITDIDMPIQPAESILAVPDIYAGKNIVNVQDSIIMDFIYAPTLENIIGEASCAVLATVNGFENSIFGCTPWTGINISIDKVLKGDSNIAGNINVYTFGGYVPMRTYLGDDAIEAHGTDMTDEEIDNTVWFITYENYELPKVDKQYIFFIKEREMDNRSVYELVYGNYGQLFVNADGTLTKRAAQGEKSIFTMEEINDKVKTLGSGHKQYVER